MSESALDRARALYRAGRYRDAAELLRDELARNGERAELLALLAWCFDALAAPRESADAVARALALDPNQVSALALAYQRAERERRDQDAVEFAQRMAALCPNDVAAQFNLGMALSRLPERGDDARAALGAVLALDPRHWPARLALGQQCFALGDYSAAAGHCRAAVELASQQPDAWLWLGLSELRRNRPGDALTAFRRALELDPKDADAWRGMAEAAELNGLKEDVLTARRNELELRPDLIEARVEAAKAFSRFGLDHEARVEVERALALAPDQLLPRWLDLQLLPRIYCDAAEQAHWHRHWLARLAEFEQLDPDDPTLEPELLQALGTVTNFSLHYQGGTLLEEQRRYGALLTRWAQRCLPPARSRPQARRDRRLRVGFASTHLGPHTISKLFRRWLLDLDRDRFEIYAIQLGSAAVELAPGLALSVERVLGPQRSISAWVEALNAAEFDALVWLDIGMDGTTQALSPLRFAPVQCVAWGHPVTTGLGSIDYFLSGAAMEAVGSQAHYSERLEALPNLGICYDLPERARGYSRTPRQAGGVPVFFCAQSVYKLTPLHYDLFARIAAALPSARFEFCPHPAPELSVRERFAENFRAAFAARGQDFAARAMVHPFLDQARFFETLARADVLLDTVGWSGGNTTLEALAMELPVVTLPGATMRSRHSHGMLKLLGLERELSARDLDHYVVLATRLADDAAFHARVVAAIRAGKSQLFGDVAPIRALEEFLWQACGRS